MFHFYGIMTLLFDTVGWVTERHLACKNVFHKNSQRFAFQDPTEYILGCHHGWVIGGKLVMSAKNVLL